MDVLQLNFLDAMIKQIKELAKLVFNVRTQKQREVIFGLTDEQMRDSVSKIVAVLPPAIFAMENKKQFDEIKQICAREFVFFQVQEKWQDPQYKKNLQNFIDIFSKDIKKKIGEESYEKR